jgi:hypothetical protein
MSIFWGYVTYLIYMYFETGQEMAIFMGILVSIMVAKNDIKEAIRRK